MLPDVIPYVPDPKNGRPIADGQVFFLLGGYTPPGSATDVNPAFIAEVTADGIAVTQPIFTSKGGTLLVGSQSNQPQLEVDPLVRRVAVYDKCGRLIYSTAYNGVGPFVSADALAAVDSTTLVGGLPAGSIVVTPRKFGAVGDGVADDTVALQDFINYCRENQVKGIADSVAVGYRTTAQLRHQPTGIFKPIDIDLMPVPIIVDFDGGTGILIDGGASRQTIKAVVQKAASKAYDLTLSGIDDNETGVLLSNVRCSVELKVSGFKGNNVIISTTAANSNVSDYLIEANSGGRGVLITGTDDNLSVSTSAIRTTNNGREGIRVEDTAALRHWKGFWYTEKNWKAAANTPANYGCYIGKATDCDLWIYSEQNDTTSEIYAHPVNVIGTRIFSARRNKDVISGKATAWYGNQFYQNDYNGTNGETLRRKAEPAIISGKLSRLTTAGDYVRLPFTGASDAPFGWVRGELNGMHLDASSGKAIGVVPEYSYEGITSNRAYTGSAALTTGSPSVDVVLVSGLASARAFIGRVNVVGRSGAGTGKRYYHADYYLDGTTVTISTPSIDVSPAPNPPVVSLNVSGTDLRLSLSYLPGQWGASYTFVYSVDLIFL